MYKTDVVKLLQNSPLNIRILEQFIQPRSHGSLLPALRPSVAP